MVIFLQLGDDLRRIGDIYSRIGSRNPVLAGEIDDIGVPRCRCLLICPAVAERISTATAEEPSLARSPRDAVHNCL
jgi:hypothetical protein